VLARLSSCVIKEFFLNYQPHIYADCVVSGFGSNVETLGDPEQDWRVTMIDTGVWRNIGERLFAVRPHVEDEEMFLANYSDGLSDVDLPAMIEYPRYARSAAREFHASRPAALTTRSASSSAASLPPVLSWIVRPARAAATTGVRKTVVPPAVSASAW
jgi:NDP-sugar pyrophosphorylase family protein